jgi:positive regulator of sigma E activity
MPDIRTVAVTVPPLLRELLKDLLAPAGGSIWWVGCRPAHGPAQLVVLGLAEGENHASAALPLLTLLPSAWILVLAYSGRHARVHGH